MTEQNAIDLKNTLEPLGFGDAVPFVEDIRLPGQDSFSIFHQRDIGNDQLHYTLHFERNNAAVFLFKKYALTVRSVPIPKPFAVLESRIQQAGELYHVYSSGTDNNDDQRFCAAVDKELKELLRTDRTGAELLMFKYWSERNYAEFIPDDSSLRQKYDRTLTITVGHSDTLTALEAYEKVKQRNEGACAI